MGEQVRRFVEPVRDIRVGMGEAFAIALAGNPTTGYTWQARVDARHLELVSQKFERRGEGIGAGGQEVFYLRALEAGETEVVFEQRRPWGGAARDTRQFRIAIA